MGKEIYAIVAKCDPYNSRKHYHGQKVLKYDGATPIHWVIKEFDNYEDAQAALYEQALDENGLVQRDYDTVLDEVREMEDLQEIKQHIEEFFENGDGIYLAENNAFVMSENDDSYTYDTITYSVEFLDTPKKAFLVTASVCTRVVVDEDASDEEIMDAAKARLLNNLNSDYYDNIEDIIEDNECPYGTFKSDKK